MRQMGTHNDPITCCKVLMDAVEDYTRKWIKREQEDIDSLSDWVKAVKS